MDTLGVRAVVSSLIVASMVVVLQPEAAEAADRPSYDEQFRRYWFNGEGELAGYDLVYSRYGELRKGTAVLVWVTESFSEQARVKAESAEPDAEDVYPVIKLNLVQDFPTGVYDYNMMTSVFVQLQDHGGRAPGRPTKVSFSSQEWCGHVYSQALFGKDSVDVTWHSYFEGEADGEEKLSFPDNAVSADTLPMWARGLSGPSLKPGEKISVPILMSLERSRLDHKKISVEEAVLSRSAKLTTVDVPAGTFSVRTLKAKLNSGLEYTYYVEDAFPNRLILWRSNRGDEGRMRGSDRMKYWELNGLKGTKELARIGL